MSQTITMNTVKLSVEQKSYHEMYKPLVMFTMVSEATFTNFNLWNNKLHNMRKI